MFLRLNIIQQNIINKFSWLTVYLKICMESRYTSTYLEWENIINHKYLVMLQFNNNTIGRIIKNLIGSGFKIFIWNTYNKHIKKQWKQKENNHYIKSIIICKLVWDSVSVQLIVTLENSWIRFITF